MAKEKEKPKGAKTNSASNAGLMSVALACVAAGSAAMQQSVLAGVFLISLAIVLPFLREYMKK